MTKSKMKIISIHSHKGGVGKSTFLLFLAKYLAQVKKEKTCLVDLDFQAQGLRSIYLRKYLKHDLSDLLMAKEIEKPGIIDEIAVKHEEIDNLYFIANFFKSDWSVEEQVKKRQKMYLKLANEIYTGEITYNLLEVIKRLQASGFKNCLVDCHPGLVLISDEVIQKLQPNPIFITTANIVSFVGLFQNLLSKMTTPSSKFKKINIIINRVPPAFSLEVALDNFLNYRQITDDERVVCRSVKDIFLKKDKIRVSLIKENDQIRNMDTLINPATLLTLDLPQDIRECIKLVYDSEDWGNGN